MGAGALRRAAAPPLLQLLPPLLCGACAEEAGGAAGSLCLAAQGLARDHAARGARLDLARDAEEVAYLNLGAVNTTFVAELREMLTPEAWTAEEEERTNAVLKGRRAKFYGPRPGVTTIRLIYSDMDLTQFFEFPWWDRFKPAVLPILQGVFEQYGLNPDRHVIRAQLNRVEPGGEIRPHVDQGIWATNAHRVHVPVVANADCSIFVRRHGAGKGRPHLPWRRLLLQEGFAYELNNRWQHRVVNEGSTDRVHLLVDWTDTGDRRREVLAPGQVCHEDGLLQGLGCRDWSQEEYLRALRRKMAGRARRRQAEREAAGGPDEGAAAGTGPASAPAAGSGGSSRRGGGAGGGDL
ncbi:unnamed protein product [Prorocentrum cordatum]|uniref:Aspartyl/asparaginy/proline hydroxylase domain-containing protein n=1 Tax=Prorocentrum cordatum TaxID=2364126 RepID=A0ABN9WGX5_9DINO|nr:unnamed protein product [Polarella glacialis]